MDAPEDAGVEPLVQLVERPVVRHPGVLARHHGNAFVGQRGENNVFGLHEHESVADLDRQPLAPALTLRDELDDLLQLLVDRAPRPGRPIRVHPAPGALDRDFEPRLIDRFQQVVDRVDLERLDGVLIVRGDEDDMRSPSSFE